MSHSLAIAHHDEPSFELLFGGRPVWYALLVSSDFQRRVMSSFLAEQFPVVVVPPTSPCGSVSIAGVVDLAPMTMLQALESRVVKDSAESPASLTASRHRDAGHAQLRHSEHPNTSCAREKLIKQSKKWSTWGGTAAPGAHFSPLLRATGTVIRGKTQLSPPEEAAAMRQRFLLWLSKCRHIVQAERVADVFRSVASLIRDATDATKGHEEHQPQAMTELVTLLKSVVEHPSERRRISIRVPSLAAPSTWSDEDILMLELVTFSFLPKNRMSAMKHSLANIPASRLVSEPRLLSLSRRANSKHFVVDAGISIDVLYRSKSVRTALSRWWSQMPKRVVGGSGGPGQEVVLRSSFVQLQLLILRELFGSELFSTQECAAAAKELLEWDWPKITSLPQAPVTGSGVMSPRSMSHSGGIAGIGQPKPSSSPAAGSVEPPTSPVHATTTPSGPVPKAPATQLMLSLASSVTPETTTMHQTLFEVALLTMIEPWMETVLPEERELCLAMLHERCFKDEDGGGRGKTLRSISPPATTAKAESPQDKKEGKVGEGSLTVVSPPQRSLSPQQQAHPVGGKAHAADVLTSLVEQLDASTAANPKIVEEQQWRNNKEESDVAVAASKEEWRRSLVQQRLVAQEVKQSHRALAAVKSGASDCGLPRDYRHHSAPQSYDLERVLLQRLSRQLAEAGPERSTHRAETFLEATKRIIPPHCRREFALRNQQAVEDFRATVEHVALRECGVKALIDDATIVSAAIEKASPDAHYAASKGDVTKSSQASSSTRMRQRIHRFFVRMPQSSDVACDESDDEDGGDKKGGDNGFLVKPKSRPTSAAYSRPTSAAVRSTTSFVGIFSPFSHVGKLPATLRPMSGGMVRKPLLPFPESSGNDPK